MRSDQFLYLSIFHKLADTSCFSFPFSGFFVFLSAKTCIITDNCQILYITFYKLINNRLRCTIGHESTNHHCHTVFYQRCNLCCCCNLSLSHFTHFLLKLYEVFFYPAYIMSNYHANCFLCDLFFSETVALSQIIVLAKIHL